MSGGAAWLIVASGALTAALAVVVQALAAGHLARTPHARRILRSRAALLAGGTVAGLLGTGLVWRVGAHPDTLVVGWLVVISPALVGLDVVERRLPDALTLGSYPLVAGLIAVEAVRAGAIRPVAGAAVGLLLVGGFYLAVAVLTPAGGLGAGDVKLAGLVGIVMGSLRVSDAIIATVIGLVIGAIGGAATMARSRNAQTHIAMAPAILSGALVTAFIDGYHGQH